MVWERSRPLAAGAAASRGGAESGSCSATWAAVVTTGLRARRWEGGLGGSRGRPPWDSRIPVAQRGVWELHITQTAKQTCSEVRARLGLRTAVSSRAPRGSASGRAARTDRAMPGRRDPRDSGGAGRAAAGTGLAWAEAGCQHSVGEEETGAGVGGLPGGWGTASTCWLQETGSRSHIIRVVSGKALAVAQAGTVAVGVAVR